MKRDSNGPNPYERGAATLNRIPAILLLSLLLAVLSALFPACGKKGPPFLPEKKLAARVDGLTGTWVDGRIRLEGTLESADKGADIAGCKIYHAWYPQDRPPCEGCPIEMMAFTDTVETTISGNRFICDISIPEKKGIWFFEVRLIGSRDAVGPPSERIRVQIEN
jgi:predicted small lipoprotein YifL